MSLPTCGFHAWTEAGRAQTNTSPMNGEVLSSVPASTAVRRPVLLSDLAGEKESATLQPGRGDVGVKSDF